MLDAHAKKVLRDNQFGNYLMERSQTKDEFGHETNYNLYRRSQDIRARDVTTEVGAMTISHHPERDLVTEHPEAQEMHRPGLAPMSHTEELPAEDEVYYLGSAKGHQLGALTMAGVATNVARKQGRELSLPTNLSKHSSRLIEGLKGRGLADPSAPTTITNKLQFIRPTRVGSPDPAHIVPLAEVREGQKTRNEWAKQRRQR